MNTSGEVADLFVKEGIQITEATAKLAGLGAKNLAAIVIALIKDSNKLQGKTNIKQLLKSEKPLCIMTVKKSDLSKFHSEAKKYGVLYSAVSDKTKNIGYCDIIAKQEDVTKLNYIIEKLDITIPKLIDAENEPEQPDKTDGAKAPKSDKADGEKVPKGKDAPEDNAQKKANPRPRESQRGQRSTGYGDIAETVRATNRPSVKAQVKQIRSKSKSNSTKPRQKGISR